MPSFAERLNQAMHKKTCKAVDVTKATGVIASVISRYRSGQHQPTISNVFAIAKYLKVSPEWLLNGSDAPEWTKPSQGTLWDKDKIIGVQEELIQKFKQENEELRQKIKKWEDWKASSEDRHERGKAKTESHEYLAITTKSGNTSRDRAIAKAKRELKDKKRKRKK